VAEACDVRSGFYADEVGIEEVLVVGLASRRVIQGGER
jgi:hypothetical protein